MDTKAIAEQLRALASNDTHRSKAARFRDVFDDVEKTLTAGVSRTLVLETLSDLGIDYTLKGFDSALHRNRMKRSRHAGKLATVPSTNPDTEPQPLESITAGRGSYNPTDLDKIIANKPDLAALAKLAKRKSP